MPRIRTIKPEFWEDETVGTLSLGARLLFIATWNLADDEGLLRWSPAYLKASAFMYDDDVSVDQVESWMRELEEQRLVFPYQAGKAKQRCAFIVNFHRHQRINRPQPGRLPPPSIQSRAVRLMYSFRDRFTCGICKKPITEEWGDDGPSLDHVKPRSKGGSNYPTNIQTTHLRCNKSKRDTAPAGAVKDSLSDSVNQAWNDSLTNSAPEGMGGEGDGNGREKDDAVSYETGAEGPDVDVARRLMPIVRGVNDVPGLYGASRKPSRGRSEDQDVDTLRKLHQRGHPLEDLEAMILGAVMMREAGELTFAKPGQTMTTGAFFIEGKGIRPFAHNALDYFHKHSSEDRWKDLIRWRKDTDDG